MGGRWQEGGQGRRAVAWNIELPLLRPAVVDSHALLALPPFGAKGTTTPGNGCSTCGTPARGQVSNSLGARP